MIVLIALAIAFVLYSVQKSVFEKVWDKGLDADVEFMEESATEGGTCTLKETIYNAKFFPVLMLNVKFIFSRDLCAIDDNKNVIVSDTNHKNDVFSVMSYQKITRTADFLCQKRGYYYIDEISMITTNPLSRGIFVKHKKMITSIVVYPKSVDVTRLDIPFRKMMGAVLTKRFSYEDPFEFRTIRDYQSFDSMKSVNWKATAKTGELKVNSHNYTVGQDVCILLDLDSETEWVDNILIEESIRLASSIADMLIYRGISVSLKTNGVDILSGDEVSLDAGSGRSHAIAIKTGLARIDLSKSMRVFSKADMVYNRQTLYILISFSKDDNIKRKFSDICSHSEAAQWILVHRFGKKPEQSNSQMDLWEAEK